MGESIQWERRRAVLFINLRSGRSRRWLPSIVAECRRRGIMLEATHFDLDRDAVERSIQQAQQQGIDTVLVAGGDGTVGAVLQQTSRSDSTLGVIPAGTSNDFARSLCIPMTVAGAIDVIARGMVARIDLGEAGHVPFGHAAVMGINTQFAEIVQSLRHRFGRASYPLGCGIVYAKRAPFEAEIEGDGVLRRFQAYEVAFVNAPVYGGPLALEVPDADLQDRSLSVVVVEEIKLLSVLRAVPAVFAHHRLSLPGITAFTAREVIVRTQEPMPVTIDGEIRSRTPVRVKVLPGAQKVFVPRAFVERKREKHSRG